MTAPYGGSSSPYDETQWAVPGSSQPPPSYPPPYPSTPPPGYTPPPDYGAVPYPAAPPPPAYPAPGYSPYPGPAAPISPYYPSAPGNNGMAIAALITSIVGVVIGIPLMLLCFIGAALPITAVVLGIVALNQIKRTQQPGRGMAIAGIAVGGSTLALGAVFFIVYIVALAAGSH